MPADNNMFKNARGSSTISRNASAIGMEGSLIVFEVGTGSDVADEWRMRSLGGVSIHGDNCDSCVSAFCPTFGILNDSFARELSSPGRARFSVEGGVPGAGSPKCVTSSNNSLSGRRGLSRYSIA